MEEGYDVERVIVTQNGEIVGSLKQLKGETSADLTALEKKGLDRKTNHEGRMKAETQPRSARPPPWRDKLRIDCESVDADEKNTDGNKGSDEVFDRGESMLWLAASYLEAQGYKPRRSDECYAFLEKVWNELERYGFFKKSKSRVKKHDDQSKEHHNEGANLDQSCRSERFIVEKCPMRYESIGSREFDEHSESEFLVSTIEALRKNLAPKCNVKRNGSFDPC